MRDARVIVHLQPDEVLVERGETEGLVRCHKCDQVTEHYVTCPGDDDTNFYLWARDGAASNFTWRCEDCQELAQLNGEQTVWAIYAKRALRE